MNRQTFKRKIIAFLPVIALVCAVIFAVSDAAAWFTARYVLGSASVTAGALSLPSFHAWRFDMSDGGVSAEGESVTKNGTWVDITATPVSADKPLCMQSVTEDTTLGGEKLTFQSLQLGTIDNLDNISKDNIFYIRIDVTDVETMGRSVKATYSIDPDQITVYDSQRNAHTSSTVNSPVINFSSLYPIIRVDAAVSTVQYNNPDTIPAALFPGDDAKLTHGVEKSVTSAEQSGAYYVYIRVKVEFSGVVDAMDMLSTYMPCEIVFSMDLSLEFYNIYKG